MAQQISFEIHQNFANKSLPPLSPSMPSSMYSLKDADGSSQGRDNGLPPRKGHSRSNSDVLFGISAIIQYPPHLMIPMNLDNVEAFYSPRTEDKSKDSSGDNSNETESALRVKRSAPVTRHLRSLSMDSAFFANFSSVDESQKLPTSLEYQLSPPSNSLNESSPKLNFDIGSVEFSEAEMKKIMADERLAEVATTDPKQAKRILANRHSAARSKERKLRYISELEHKVHTLQIEATTLSAQITTVQKDFSGLKSENNELQFRLQAMGHQAQLRDALHESLSAEIQCLKLAMGESREEGKLSNHAPHEISQKHRIFQIQCQQRGQVQVSYCQ